MATVVMDLDLNCSPPSPEPAAQEDLRRSMLRQQHAFRDQVQDLHRLYWTQKNLTPFWKQSDAFLYGTHQPNHPSHSHTVDLDGTENPGAFGHCYGQRKQSGYRCVIDLEKPATLDDDVEVLSSRGFTNYATPNGVFSDNSRCVPLEVSPVMRHLCRDHTTPYVSSAASCTSCCLLLATGHSGDFCNSSSKTFHKGSESSIGSSKGSSITVVKTISVPDGSREAPGLFCDSQSTKPFCVEIPKYNALLRGNMHHQHALDNISGLDSQGCMKIPRKVFSVSSSGGNNSSGLSTLGDSRAANLAGQPTISVRWEPQEETITVISDDEMEGIDLNVAAFESIELPSKVTSNSRGKPANNDGSEENSPNHYFTQNEGRQNISSVEYPTDRSHRMAESKSGEDVQSPASGIAINRSVVIRETPQGHDYACPRLRSLSNGASIPLETVSIHQDETGEDETTAATAAETLVFIFANNSAWMADSHGSNIETDAEDGNHEAPVSLDSFEEGILSLEEMKDDGESIPVRPADKDGPSCGIKLKRGRGLRDFQREILPGLVSLARHEICDDLHSIGYEVRKTRLRRTCGDQGTPPTRTRLPRRCSTAWNR